MMPYPHPPPLPQFNLDIQMNLFDPDDADVSTLPALISETFQQEPRAKTANARWTPPEPSIPEIFDGAEPAGVDHPYLQSLGISTSHGFIYQGPEIAGVDLGGCFMDAIKNIQGETVNAFFAVPSEAGEFQYLYVPAAPLVACCTYIGVRTHQIVVTADYQSGLAIHEATGLGVAVSHYDENLPSICENIRKRHPASKIVIAAGARMPKDFSVIRTILSEASTESDVLVALPRGFLNFHRQFQMRGASAIRNSIAGAAPFVPESEAASFALGDESDELDEEVARAATAWPVAVHPASLLAAMCAHIARHAALPFNSIYAIALWTLATHFAALFRIAPILALLSLTRRCGKTSTIAAIAPLTRQPELTSDITPATLFRLCDLKVTMFLDEADQYLRRVGSPLIVILNAGHSRIASKIKRTIGGKPQTFDTFGYKTIAAIEILPTTVTDRSIVIPLMRKLVEEEVVHYAPSRNDNAVALRSQIAAFVADAKPQVKSATATAPLLNNDRAMQNWQPLMAIASCGGSKWVENAREAAIALTPSDDDVPSVLEELVRDLAVVFRKAAAPYLSSMSIVESLNANPDLPWATYRDGRALGIHDFARLMKRLKLRSTQKQVSKGTVIHVYFYADLSDLFARYST